MVYSPYAEFMRRNHPEIWLQIWNPTVHRAYTEKTKGSEDTADMLIQDEAMTVDCLPPDLGYKFPCKVFVFIALWLSSKAFNAQNWEQIPEEDWSRELVKERRKYFCNGKGYNFDPEEFEEWHKWADDVVIYKVETGHKGVVTHQRFKTVIYREVDKLVAPKKEKKRLRSSKRQNGTLIEGSS